MIIQEAAQSFQLGSLVKDILLRTREAGDPTYLIHRVRGGLPIEELEALQRSLGIPMDQLAPRLGLAKATLHRRKVAGRLQPDESERVVRYARLFAQAVEVLEGQEEARAWLNAPQLGLGWEKPLDYAATELGAREVEDLLGRIDESVYS